MLTPEELAIFEDAGLLDSGRPYVSMGGHLGILRWVILNAMSDQGGSSRPPTVTHPA